LVVLVELIYVLKCYTFFKRYFTRMQSHLMEKDFLGIIPSYMGRIFFDNYPIPSHAENVAMNFDHIRDILISLIQLDKFMVLPIANINWWYSCHEHRSWYATFYPFFFSLNLSFEYVSPSYSDWDTWNSSWPVFLYILSCFFMQMAFFFSRVAFFGSTTESLNSLVSTIMKHYFLYLQRLIETELISLHRWRKCWRELSYHMYLSRFPRSFDQNNKDAQRFRRQHLEYSFWPTVS